MKYIKSRFLSLFGDGCSNGLGFEKPKLSITQLKLTVYAEATPHLKAW